MPTGIPYLDEVWNPIIGCSHCSPGCDNCWAEGMAYRLSCMESARRKNQRFYWDYGNVVNGCGEANHRSKWNGKTVLVERMLDKPLHWKKPRNIGVCFMGDLFHESVPFEWIDRVFAIMIKCLLENREHNFLILTKRPKRMAEYERTWPSYKRIFDNLWFGVSVCNQDEAWKIDVLRDIPAANRWVSFEPLLEYVRPNMTGIDWAVVGIESGANRRSPKKYAVEKTRNIIQDCHVPIYIKQVEIDDKVCTDITKFSKDLQIQEYPKGLTHE